MRRIVLAGLALAAAVTVSEVPRAEAQVTNSRNPWCLRDGVAMGRGSWDCSYYNFRQCDDSARGTGGTCTPNPNYRGPRQGRQPQPQDGWGGWGGRW